MTMLACLPGRTERRGIHRDRSWKVVHGQVVELAHAVDLCLHIGGGTATHMALHAVDTGMRRSQIGDKLGLHRDMADLAAELN